MKVNEIWRKGDCRWKTFEKMSNYIWQCVKTTISIFQDDGIGSLWLSPNKLLLFKTHKTSPSHFKWNPIDASSKAKVILLKSVFLRVSKNSHLKLMELLINKTLCDIEFQIFVFCMRLNFTDWQTNSIRSISRYFKSITDAQTKNYMFSCSKRTEDGHIREAVIKKDVEYTWLYYVPQSSVYLRHNVCVCVCDKKNWLMCMIWPRHRKCLEIWQMLNRN